MRALSVLPDDEALQVSWVRWVPDEPIPISRYNQRYGTPVCSFSEAMKPICTWKAVELEASMSTDEKSVNFVTTIFTQKERQQGFLRHYGYIPDFLK